MERAIEFFITQLRSIRQGEISAGLIDTVRVDAYDQRMPISQIAWTVSQQGRILISPHDPQLLGTIDKALKKEGFNSYIFSKTQVVVSLPPRSAEDREKVVGQIKKLAEEAKISIRNIRQKVRKKETSKEIDKPLQKLTDETIDEIDLITEDKIESFK